MIKILGEHECDMYGDPSFHLPWRANAREPIVLGRLKLIGLFVRLHHNASQRHMEEGKR